MALATLTDVGIAPSSLLQLDKTTAFPIIFVSL